MNGLTIIPAIDLMGGKCVRLRQGQEEEVTLYGGDPVERASEWMRQGARRLHIVDLDGAFGRPSGHMAVLQEISRRVGIEIEFGGGIRSMDRIGEALRAGADKVVLGTMAVNDPAMAGEAVREFGAERIIVALDAREGRVAVRGWVETTEGEATVVAALLYRHGVREILYTDIARDGMMAGPDLKMLPELARTGLSVLASGGVSGVEDVRSIVALREPRIAGVIVGKALYDHRVTLAELIDAAEGRC